MPQDTFPDGTPIPEGWGSGPDLRCPCCVDKDAEIARLRAAAQFDRFNLDHKPSYVLMALNEGEISLAKACEWLRHYFADGTEGPIVQNVMRTGGFEGVSLREMAEEIARLRAEVADLKRQLAEAQKHTERHGLYFASKVRHAADWRALRVAGYPVTSSWIDEADEGQTADYSELSTRCLQEIQRSACLVLCCQPREILKGALLEAGAALAFGVPVFCVAPAGCESISRVFREHPLWHDFDTLRAALDAARKGGRDAPSDRDPKVGPRPTYGLCAQCGAPGATEVLPSGFIMHKECALRHRRNLSNDDPDAYREAHHAE